MNKVRWGIIGTGKIARKLASDLLLAKSAVLQGVASRDIAKAKDFSATYHAHSFYGSYEELVKDPTIDVVYVATPHPLHFENTMMCLEHGKHVLCEKPMGMNAKEVKAMVDSAISKGLFLMEGIWTRFIPAVEKMVELLNNGAIGEVTFIRADFGFKAAYNPEGRLYNKGLGGGSLLDIGIYPVYLSLLTLGVPTAIKALARMSDTGVDTYCSMLFDYTHSGKAILESTIEADTPTEAYIYGTKGFIKMHHRFHHTQKLTVHREDEPDEVIAINYTGEGYLHEIEEVNACINAKWVESSKLPHNVSINLSTVLDRVREEIGLTYSS